MKEIDFRGFASLNTARELVRSLEIEFLEGSGKAGFWLSVIYSEGNTFVPKEVGHALGVSDVRAMEYTIKSFYLLMEEAKKGDGGSMHLIANYYQTGTPPVKPDIRLAKYWTDKAAEAGCVCVENLLAIYGDPESEFYDPEKARELRKQL